jgi:hypothetical protein
VRCDKLAIEQRHSATPQRRDQPGQRDFGRVRLPAEHALAAEHPVKPHAIEPTDQLAVAPAFDRVRLPQPVQRHVTCFDPVADPALAAAVFTRGRAGLHHLAEGSVAGDGKRAAPERSGQRVRAVELVQRQYSPAVGLYPEDIRIITRIRHRKDPAAIGEHQHLRIDGFDLLHQGGVAQTSRNGNRIDRCPLS